jgi:hypothetical protein
MNRLSLLRAPTRYEIVAKHPDGRTYLVAYAAGSPSRHHLLSAMRARGQAIISACSIPESDQMTFGTKPRHHALVSGWTIAYTGRTQRECCTTEHPYIAEVTS